MAQGIQQFRLPDAGEGLTEAEILRWNVQPGDEVAVNQVIVEVETAKAVVELPSPYAGTVAELLVKEGATVPVGTPIISVDTGGSQPGAPEPPAAEPEEATTGGGVKREPVLVGYGVKESATRRRPRKSPDDAEGKQSWAGNGAEGRHRANAAAAAAYLAPTQPSERAAVLAKPPVRKLAKDLGVDLASVDPTGQGGVVTREDVRRSATPEAPVRLEGDKPGAAERSAAEEREERIPVKGIRKHTAAAMVASAFTAPHVTEFLQVDVTEMVEAARRLRERPEFAETKVSPLLLVAKALLAVVRRYPGLNASWDGDAGEIVVKHYVNLGIAAATERGLVVPNIKDAHTLALPELARALQELTETARAGKSALADLSGGTISVTNVGVFGVDAGTPIINPGEAAILALGQIRDMPWVYRGELAVRKVTTLALSFDHRMIDGELGSKALRDLGAMLEDPLAALAWG